MSQRLPSLRLNVVEETRREARGGYGSLARLGAKIASLADREIRLCQSESSILYDVACKPGCSACCTRLVEATLPDVVATVDAIYETWSEEEIQEFLARETKVNQANKPLWHDEIDRPLAPCAFLKDGLCSVYATRPLSCRSLNSDDPSRCESLFLEGINRGLNANPDQVEVSTLAKAVVVGMHEAGVSTGTYDFAPTVRLFLENPDLADQLKQKPNQLERLKLFSENSRLEEEISDPAKRLRQTPAGNRLLDYLHAPAPQTFYDHLEQFKGTPAGALYSMWLPLIYSSQAEAEDCWQRLERAVDEFAEYEGSPSEIFDLAQGFNLFSWAYADRDALPLTAKFMDRMHHWASLYHPRLQEPLGPRKPGKFRLGFVSSRMTNFNGARWAFGVLLQPNPEVETWVFNLAPLEDSTSYCFRRAADNYRHLPFFAADVAKAIREADLDALVFTDVGMDGRSMQLASFRMARRQYTAWGHPASSGAPEIEFYLSSDHMEAPDADAHYRERLVRLPKNGLATPYRTPVVSTKSATELGLPKDGFLIYAQYFHKLHPNWDEMFLRLAEESTVPLVFLGGRTTEMSARLRARLKSDKIIVRDEIPRPDYLRALQLADASLEAPSFGGGFTALDALSVKTPIVTLPGRFMRQRLSLGFMREAGIGHLAVSTPEAYIKTATDRDALRSARENITTETLFSNDAAIYEFYDFMHEHA